MIKCKNCGADTRFDIERQCLVCDFCDSTFEVISNNSKPVTSEENLLDAVIHTCPQCGAELYTTEDTAATFCSYCGSNVLLESRFAAVTRPDFIIPFKVTREQAESAYRAKLRRALFAPKDIREAEIRQLRPIYMPYWEYRINTKTALKVEYTSNPRSKGGYMYKDVNEIAMDIEVDCDGLEYDASDKLPDDLSRAYAPYYFKESKLFRPEYMSGFYADLNDVPAVMYKSDAVNVVKYGVSQEIFQNSDIREKGITRPDIASSLRIDSCDAEEGLAMYPVWFACARSKNGKYINYAAVNGQSGKVAADLPVDMKKVLLWSFIFAIPIFMFLYLLFTPSPVSTLILVGLLSIAGTAVGCSKAASLERSMEPKGRSGRRKKKKADSSSDDSQNLHSADALKRCRKNMILRLLGGLAVCALIILLKPVHDFFYYGGAILASALCGFTYWKLFAIHNTSIERPLPQLDKRGGEEQ